MRHRDAGGEGVSEYKLVRDELARERVAYAKADQVYAEMLNARHNCECVVWVDDPLRIIASALLEARDAGIEEAARAAINSTCPKEEAEDTCLRCAVQAIRALKGAV